MRALCFTAACGLSIALAALSGGLSSAQSSVADLGFRARVADQSFVPTQVSASTAKIGGKEFINITGNRKGAQIASLGFNIAGHDVGTYPLGRDPLTGSHGRYTTDLIGADINEDIYRFESGSVVISRYNAATHVVSGTFSAVAKNRSGKSLAITDGVFTDIAVTQVPTQ